MSTIDDLRSVRTKKAEKLRTLGIDPYPAETHRTHAVLDARASDGKTVTVAGRITGMRGHGKLSFIDLTDASGKIQIVVKSDRADADARKLMEFLDLGDFLDVHGTVGKTQAGEISVFADKIHLLAKSIRPLPDHWYGLKDVEERYRQRYADLLMNNSVRDVFLTRSRVITFLRKFFDTESFVEVETPILQPIYGGASAKPFVTRHNALDTDLYLRISDELYLKRLIVGGLEKVYEIGHDFRNEGVDRQHNPEFTMMEFYWAYADYEMLMQFTQRLFAALLKEIRATLTIEYQGKKLDFTPPWKRLTYRTAVLEHTGIDIDMADTHVSLKKAIKDAGIPLDAKDAVGYGALLDALYKQTTRPKLTGPLFLTERPTSFVSLAKRLPGDSNKTASFQLLIAGREIINAYNELNDPVDQAKRWRESEKLGERGQTEHEAFDADYIRALEYGMPPTAGWGMGIDNVVAILTDQSALKDVILFPTLRPESP
jgi:lysyl-tRNA synthetase class 2